MSCRKTEPKLPWAYSACALGKKKERANRLVERQVACVFGHAHDLELTAVSCLFSEVFTNRIFVLKGGALG
jgi:hypothetical protein